MQDAEAHAGLPKQPDWARGEAGVEPVGTNENARPRPNPSLPGQTPNSLETGKRLLPCYCLLHPEVSLSYWASWSDLIQTDG